MGMAVSGANAVVDMETSSFPPFVKSGIRVSIYTVAINDKAAPDGPRQATSVASSQAWWYPPSGSKI